MKKKNADPPGCIFVVQGENAILPRKPDLRQLAGGGGVGGGGGASDWCGDTTSPCKVATEEMLQGQRAELRTSSAAEKIKVDDVRD